MAVPTRGICKGLFHALEVSRSLVWNLVLLADHEECCVATSASTVISFKSYVYWGLGRSGFLNWPAAWSFSNDLALLSGILCLVIWGWHALFPADTVWVFHCTCGLPLFRTLLLKRWELVCSVSKCFSQACTMMSLCVGHSTPASL